jgi:hypothetical protein
VKLAGDGAPMHRSTSNILLSFSLPSLDPAATSSILIGTHTFAVLEGAESYNHMREWFAPVIQDINHLIKTPEVILSDSTRVELDIVLGGDL